MDPHLRFCPRCARASELPLRCERCGWRWYANPKPAAGAVVEWRSVAPDGEEGEPSVLLLRRAVEPGAGGWDLPAGYLDPHESPEQAALRETREEAGLEIELIRLLGAYTSRHGNAVSCIYLARPLAEDPRVILDSESSEFAWVERRRIASWLERMAFPAMAAALTDWMEDRTGVPRLPQDTARPGNRPAGGAERA
jgi:ADP-ribose pyrophosphatase YjhB (NUDIX family)